MKHAKQVIFSATFGVSLLAFGLSMGSAVSAAGAGAGQQAGDGMPPGPGHDITVATCTKCHSITNITGQHKDKDGWTATITKMVGYGATGSDEDFQAILDYVTKNYGLDSATPTAPAQPSAGGPAAAHKIPVNTETAAQLTTDLGLTDDEAKGFVEYRDKNGPFKTIDDLKKFPGIDGKKFDVHTGDLQF